MRRYESIFNKIAFKGYFTKIVLKRRWKLGRKTGRKGKAVRFAEERGIKTVRSAKSGREGVSGLVVVLFSARIAGEKQ